MAGPALRKHSSVPKIRLKSASFPAGSSTVTPAQMADDNAKPPNQEHSNRAALPEAHPHEHLLPSLEKEGASTCTSLLS